MQRLDKEIEIFDSKKRDPDVCRVCEKRSKGNVADLERWKVHSPRRGEAAASKARTTREMCILGEKQLEKISRSKKREQELSKQEERPKK